MNRPRDSMNRPRDSVNSPRDRRVRGIDQNRTMPNESSQLQGGTIPADLLPGEVLQM